MIEGTKALVYHNMGLGDHILCNGLIRAWAERKEYILLFVKKNNFNNVSFMFRDNKKIKLIQSNDLDSRYFLKNINLKEEDIRLDCLTTRQTDTYKNDTFDEGMYSLGGLSIQDKWDYFYFERDEEREKNVFYNILKLKDDEDFIFVHEHKERGRHIKKEHLSDLKIINPSNYQDIGIFDFLYTMEKAKEIHLHNSSFLCLVDSIQLRNDNIFFHDYVLDNPDPWITPKLKLEWKRIINK